MGIIDWAKSARQAVADKTIPQPFVFHHIPKCGGTSVGRALRKRYILSQATVRPGPSFSAYSTFCKGQDRHEMLVDVLDLREQMLLYHMFDGVHGIAAHVRFSEDAYALFKDQYKFMTVLREPVARFVSHFHWGARKSGEHDRIDDNFEDFLETPRARRLGALTVEYLYGLPKDVPTDSADAISAAISNLGRFDIVGDIADTATLQGDIKRELGVKISIGHENRHKPAGSAPRDVLENPAIREKVEALCAPDLALYNHFRSTR